MISASTNEMSAPRRHDIAGFLLVAGGNRLLFASIDASQTGSVMEAPAYPIHRADTVHRRSRPYCLSRQWRGRSTTPGLTMQLAG